MIKALSASFAEWLRKEGAVPQKDQALFSYAVYSFFSACYQSCLHLFLESFLGCYEKV